jgi:DNA (cytosine-5)-methyltransferase 1
MKHLDLFSGIGGFYYGFRETGRIQTGAFVEIDPYCQKILRKHAPNIPIYSDITQVRIQPNQFDIISGGFPCQDVSLAAQNNQQSIMGSRSGLWNHYHRLVSEGLPKWVVIENVENLRHKGLAIILWQLANLGYDAEWRVIRAADVGLPHIRQRLWIIAHSTSRRIQGRCPFPLQGLLNFPWRANGRGAESWSLRGGFTPSPLLRAGHGIPYYVDRIRALGNSVVPAIPLVIAEAILEYENTRTA